MSYRLFLFEDAGFAARALLTAPGNHYRLDLWASDITQFTGDPNPPETSASRWMNSIAEGIRQTGLGVMVFVNAPNTTPHSYFVVPTQIPPEHAKD